MGPKINCFFMKISFDLKAMVTDMSEMCSISLKCGDCDELIVIRHWLSRNSIDKFGMRQIRFFALSGFAIVRKVGN